jgi:hypothetical protein
MLGFKGEEFPRLGERQLKIACRMCYPVVGKAIATFALPSIEAEIQKISTQFIDSGSRHVRCHKQRRKDRKIPKKQVKGSVRLRAGVCFEAGTEKRWVDIAIAR